MAPQLRRRALRLVAILASGSVLAALGWFAFLRAFDARFHPVVAAAAFAAPPDGAEARRQDLEYLGHLLEVDRSFSPAAREAFERGRKALLAEAGRLTEAELVLGISRLVALADNGHTNVAVGPRTRALNRVPLRFAWFAEGLFVVRAGPEHRDLLGARVAGIGGVAPEALVPELRPFRGGGTDAYARLCNTPLLESPAALHAVRGALPADRLELALVTRDGGSRRVTIAALPPDPDAPRVRVQRTLAPAPIAGEPAGWTTPLRGDAPLSLRGPERSVFSAAAGEGALYVHLWEIQDDDAGHLSDQLLAATAPPPGGWRTLVLDLRMNGGGDYTTAYRAVKALPERLARDGRLAVLTDPGTFSAALVVAAWAKHFGAPRAVIVGEPVGDRLQFWAEGHGLVLPNSKLWIGNATGWHDWEHGCRDLRRCFWFNFLYDVPVGSLAPDVPAAWRFEDYVRGEDTVLRAALAVGGGVAAR